MIMVELMRRFAYVAELYEPGSPDAEEYAALEAMGAARNAYYENPNPDTDRCWEISQRIWKKALARLEEKE